MKTYLDCIPCFFRQALEASRIGGANEKTQKKILNETAQILTTFPFHLSPPEMGRQFHNIVKKNIHKKDPYFLIKNKSTNLALSIYPKLEQKIQKSTNKLLTAVELAIAGNIVDYGVKHSLDVNKEIDNILSEENNIIKLENKSIFNFDQFEKALLLAKNIVYLADNAGETVFDKLLIEQIIKIDKNKKIIYAVKEKPIINDATMYDAKKAGINNVATIISSGSDAPGTILSLCSKEFLKLYNKADLVISKGQGNFEALSDAKRSIFFLFMAKCPVVVKDISSNIGTCKLGNIILYCYLGKKNKK